jgi:putative Mg2+ transporter-C (MgtC) family protein
MTVLPSDLLKLLLAVLVGGVIGAEREFHNKAAGFRTLIFICVGATLFTIFSIKIAVQVQSDPARIAAQIVTGVGFIGAGVIMQDSGRIHGLTTASTIWLVSALGIGIGEGQYLFVSTATLAILIVLWLFPHFEGWIDSLHEDRTYEITFPASLVNLERLNTLLKDSQLRVRSRKQVKTGADLTCTWQVSGSPRKHEWLVQRLLDDADVKEFRF